MASSLSRSILNDPALFRDRVQRVVDLIDYRDGYTWQVAIDISDSTGRVFVQLLHWREDADNPGVMAWGKGGKRYLSPWMTDSEIVRTCLSAAVAYEEHEVREFFTYRGKRVFGPHIDVEALAEVADRLDVRP